MTCLFVAAHLRGMRLTPSSDKDILTPNEKLKTLNITNQTHNYLFLDYYNHCAYTRIRMQYVSITNAQKHSLIQTRTEPLRSKQVFTEQLILKGAIFILIYLIIYSFRYHIYRSTFLVQLQ